MHNEITNPKITVYIVSHNYGNFLDQSIESVLRQNFHDWELLLIDDGSTDNTKDIMNLYRHDSRVRIISTDGIGLPAVANLALKESRGEFMIRLDGDDIFDENILLVLLNNIQNDPEVAVTFPDYYLIDEEGEIFSHEKRHKVFESSHLLDLPPNGACSLIRKSVLNEIGGYREDLGAQDGFDLWTKIRKRYRSVNINLPLFYYRRHGKNLTNSTNRILDARRQIKRDAIDNDLYKYSPLMAIIPCRENYDFIKDLWSVELNGESLLERKIKMCLQSKLFDQVVVAADTEKVLDVMNLFNDERLHFFKRETSDTIRSKSISTTLYKISKKLDPEFTGISVLSYLPTPFVTLNSLEEALCTLIYNDMDSSMGVEEINDPVFCRTSHGLKAINPNRNLRTDYDNVYREANIALAVKNKNFSTGSLLGPSTINFIVKPEECFFVDSKKKLQIAHIIDSE